MNCEYCGSSARERERKRERERERELKEQSTAKVCRPDMEEQTKLS